MKNTIFTGCIMGLALTMAIAPKTAQAGGWATAPQAAQIIAQLRTLNRNQVQTGENIKDLESQVESSVEEAADRIIAALKGHSGEQSAYQDKQIEAARRITDAAGAQRDRTDAAAVPSRGRERRL